MITPNMVPYVLTYTREHNYYNIDYEPLNPTGKWALRIHSDGDIKVLIQHKSKFLGMTFRQWISEDSIEFHGEKTIVFDCNDK